ncbi:MAG: DMT family transporter, partial [Gammaproteobacteria bacterium]|nr:DMT family transporter [Gammaproteobacteria bacterium]NIR83800.1 DMT family transporter [Gammaproteobacteria bacterium]NIR88217.1 DMT family transporter [Gammaproteobacteria bacterium]NIU05126.1 DMT family transporter [Gammaproteobacteria bacterium]NIV51963.1 EamA family transporter [Gammaproteobacteria bacterium]
MGDTAARAITDAAHAGRDRPVAAVLFVLAAAVVIPVMDGVAKSLSARYPVTQVVWARYFFHALLLFPVVLVRYGRRSLWPHRPLLQFSRGALLLVSTGFFFAAIARMPLADALALVFISPLVVTALSPFVLGEHVGARRWTAVVVGFIGACIIIRPGFTVVQWASLFALGAGTGFACYVLATR